MGIEKNPQETTGIARACPDRVLAVNLTALASARSPMTPGEWCIDEDGEISASSGLDEMLLNVGPCDFADRDTFGMLATHNAAPVLIEVVRTLLVYNAAKQEGVRLHEAFLSEKFDTQGAWKAYEEACIKRSQAHGAHEAALAKVSL